MARFPEVAVFTAFAELFSAMHGSLAIIIADFCSITWIVLTLVEIEGCFRVYVRGEGKRVRGGLGGHWFVIEQDSFCRCSNDSDWFFSGSIGDMFCGLVDRRCCNIMPYMFRSLQLIGDTTNECDRVVSTPLAGRAGTNQLFSIGYLHSLTESTNWQFVILIDSCVHGTNFRESGWTSHSTIQKPCCFLLSGHSHRRANYHRADTDAQYSLHSVRHIWLS